MAVAPNNNIIIPYSPFLNDQTGRPNTEWLQWLMNPQFITLSLGSALPVTSGGTGLTTIPTNGQLLIGNGTGYTLNPLTPGVGIGVTNGVGLITVYNTGVLSNIAGTGISVSNPTGNVTIVNTGVLSWSGGSTGLTPAIATTGVVTIAGTLGAGYGGTGLNTYVIGDLLYASGTTAFSRLADIATGNALISGGIATAPSWGKIGLTTHVSGTLPIANGGTNGTATATAGAVAYGTGTAYAFTAAGTLGQVLTSGGAGAPTWATDGGGTVTSVAQSFTGGLISVSGSPITTSGTFALTVAGTSGGVPYFSSASTWATSAALAASSLVLGGGAGAAPATTTTGTGVVTALGVNTGTAGAFVVNGGALGTPSSGTATNLTGLPLTTGVTGILPVANGGTGLSSIAHTVQVFTSGSGTYTTPANVKAIWVRAVGGGGGAGGTGSAGAPTNGTGGGNTTFSTLTATAGSGGPNSLTGGFLGGAAGGASGGDINQSGNPGNTSIGNSSPAVFQGYGMNGGASVLGGGGRAGTNGAGATGGAATANSGGGGGGVGGNALVYASAGGGAGGYVEKLIAAPSATYSYAVGAGGAGGAAGTGGGTGGAGGSGVIIVTEYYV